MIGLKGCASKSESNRSVHLYKLASHIGVGTVGGWGGGPIILKMVCAPPPPMPLNNPVNTKVCPPTILKTFLRQ